MSDEMYMENTRARIVSNAPRPVASCNGTRYPEAKFNRDRMERTLSSARVEGKESGRAIPWEVRKRANVLVKEAENTNRLIDF